MSPPSSSSSSSSSQPFLPSLCASIVLGNSRGVVSSAVCSIVSSIEQLALSVCLNSLRFLDSYFNTQLHAPAIVYCHAKGTPVSQPDAFLEKFNELPAELLDMIFHQMSGPQTAQLQLVCRRWRDIAKLRRKRAERKLVGCMTVRFDKMIREVSSCNGHDSLGIFSGINRHQFPLEFENGVDKIRVRNLDVHLRRLTPAISSLCFDKIHADTVNLFIYDDNIFDSRCLIESLLNSLQSNTAVKEANVKLFSQDAIKTPEWLFSYSNPIQIMLC